MKKWCMLLAALLPSVLFAQSFEGSWTGDLQLGTNKLQLVFHVGHDEEGYSVKMDSPDQGVFGFEGGTVQVSAGELTIEIPALHIVYKGKHDGNGNLTGVFTQNGYSLPLILQRREDVVQRPQTPRPPFPYEEREVSFASRGQGVTLNGTLTLPENPRCAVVMVTGSGLQNRDEELFGHRPFAVIADYLSRRGVAVLRFDDRGFGLPKEEQLKFASSTTADFVEDALGGVDFVRTQPGLKGLEVGIIGHSEGGTIAFMAAAKEPGVDFIVSLAGSILSGDKVLLDQNITGLRKSGLPQEWIDKCSEVLARMFEIVCTHPAGELEAQSEACRAELQSMAQDRGLPQTLSEPIVRLFGQIIHSPWLYFFTTYDPAVAVREVRCPILALNGEKDIQVRAADHLGRLEELLDGNSSATIRRYPRLNHLFQPCETGELSEYARIGQTISEEVLSDMADWILTDALR